MIHTNAFFIMVLKRSVLYRKKIFNFFQKRTVVLGNFESYHLWSLLNPWLWLFQNMFTPPPAEYSAALQLQRNYFFLSNLYFASPLLKLWPTANLWCLLLSTVIITCARVSFLIKLQPKLVLFSEFCEIFKRIFFYRTLPS